MVLGEDLDPDAVTRALGRFPDQAWRRGETHPALARIGRERPADWGGWKKSVPDELRGETLENQFEYWADSLRGRESALARLADSGCELVLDCFVSEALPLLIELPAALQSELGALHLNIDIHVFAADS